MSVPPLRRSFLRAAALGMLVAGCVVAGQVLAAEGDDVWARLRAGLFGDRPIADAGESLLLSVPRRAEDAAIVPVAIRSAAAPGRAPVSRLYLVIDKNPSPLAGVFEFGPGIADAEIETRVRVEDYSTVRAIAERADGSLAMTTRYIKASGGCSAPANKREGDAASLGRMRWQLPESPAADGDLPVTLLIRHPNASGLAMDQMTRLYDPPHFVRQVRITWKDRLVLAADVDFSISENPAFRFTFRPGGGGGDLKAEVVDSRELRFESSVTIDSGGTR